MKKTEQNKIKFSIIVPVYKVEEYLERCIANLINQTYDNIEIIIIDDGSPDKCPEICDALSETDSRIRVIHKSNGGLSDARNTGMREAKGDYLLFVDSDDYIDLATCELFSNIIDQNRPNIVVGNARKIENGKTTIIKHEFQSNLQILNGIEYLKKELNSRTMHMAACFNIYNRAFLQDNELNFKVGLLHEDEQFTPRVFLKAKEIIGTDIVFYNYLIREGSITTNHNKIKNAEHLIQTCNELAVIYNDVNDDELRNMLNDDLLNKYLNVFQVAGLYKKQYSYLLDKSFLKGKAYTKRNKKRLFLFLLNKHLYYFVNKLSKYFFEKIK
jgi:glycosyltransferase involved in cell wall biosynthesis